MGRTFNKKRIRKCHALESKLLLPYFGTTVLKYGNGNSEFSGFPFCFISFQLQFLIFYELKMEHIEFQSFNKTLCIHIPSRRQKSLIKFLFLFFHNVLFACIDEKGLN